jgi:hypothetical protein
MKRIIHNNHFIVKGIIVIALLFSIRAIVYATIHVSSSTNVFITATVCATNPCPDSNTGGNTGGGNTGGGSSGGGGGGGGGSTVIATTVNFSGMGYPSSRVVILQDGVQAITTVADPNANFSASLSGIAAGSYMFSIYTTDKDGHHSVSFSFPVSVTAGSVVNIGGIILAPTIDVDKAEVKRGDNETIFGFAVPNSKINISVHSETEHVVSTTASATGAYLYNFDTTPLEYGGHNAQSRSILADKVSAQTDPVSFKVSTENKLKTPGCGSLVGDVNCDNKVNLIDFSILAYWYKNGGVIPKNVDLNSDGKVTLVDFSIMAYHWTG